MPDLFWNFNSTSAHVHNSERSSLKRGLICKILKASTCIGKALLAFQVPQRTNGRYNQLGASVLLSMGPFIVMYTLLHCYIAITSGDDSFQKHIMAFQKRNASQDQACCIPCMMPHCWIGCHIGSQSSAQCLQDAPMYSDTAGHSPVLVVQPRRRCRYCSANYLTQPLSAAHPPLLCCASHSIQAV